LSRYKEQELMDLQLPLNAIAEHIIRKRKGEMKTKLEKCRVAPSQHMVGGRSALGGR
jgi:hypothetical protein